MFEPERTTTSTDVFALDVLRGLAGLGLDDGEDGALTLSLSLSLWMRQSDVSRPVAIATLLSARRVLVRLAGFDEAREPIPLLHADDRTTLLNLARYVSDLIARAAVACGLEALDVAEHAMALAHGPTPSALGHAPMVRRITNGS